MCGRLAHRSHAPEGAITLDDSDIATYLHDARLAICAVAPPSARTGGCSIAQAYELQDALCRRMAENGQRPIGWKLAATGPVGQKLFGIEEPIYSFLPPSIHRSGDTVPASAFVDLHIEAEFAFRLGADLAGPGVTAAGARAAVDHVMPALELGDMLFSDRPHISDVIANAALGRSIATGTPKPLGDLTPEEVVFCRNGEELSRTLGTDLMGDPLNALAWLANALGARGITLRAGEVVMSGAVSALVRATPGDEFTANYSALGQVSVTVGD